MTQTGAIGAHIIASSPGYSRDAAVASVREIKGAYATVVNDPLLCMMLLDIGVTPIHRINRNGLLDDNQQQYGTTRLYIQTAHTEVPDKRALLNWNNEPAHDPHRLLKEGLIAVDEAVKLGRTLVMLGYSYGNPEPEVHAILDPLYRRMAETGMIYACHEGTDKAHPTLKDCYPDLIGRFLPVQKKYGFKVLVTEFAASLDALHGWQTWQTWQEYAKACEDTVREVYAPNGVYMTPFSLFPWQIGFDYHNSPELKQAWAGINVRYPVKEQPVTNPILIPPPTTGGVLASLTKLPGLFVNVRAQPNPASATSNPSADVGDLALNDVVKWFPDAKQGEWVYIVPVNAPKANAGWVSLQYGAVAFTPVPPLTPTVKGRYLSPEAQARIRAHSKAIDDANAAIMAELDTAPEVAAPDDGIPF